MTDSAYTDIGQLSRYRGNDAAQLPKVARQFESMFVDMMLKAAREATQVLASDNPFESNETRLHSEMLDHQLAVSMSEHGGIGLAQVLERQLGGVGAAAHAAGANAAAGAGTATGADPLQRLMARVRGFVGAHRVGGASEGDAGDAALAVQRKAEKKRDYADPVDFVRRVLPAVRRATAGTTLSPVAVLAQAALETGWGKSVIGNGGAGSSNNLFGIKSSHRWGGPSATVSTLEVRNGVARQENAAFRVYDSVEHSVRDLVRTLHGASRYRDVVQATDADGYADAIGRSGYATDPHYTQKLRQILNSDTLRDAIATVLAEQGEGAR